VGGLRPAASDLAELVGFRASLPVVCQLAASMAISQQKQPANVRDDAAVNIC
jgi:hypothetical protein